MRIRSIKPEFWSSDEIAALEWSDRLILIGLWSYVDDNGVGRDNPKLIVSDLFPLEDDYRETLDAVSRGLQTLHKRGFIARYVVDGKPYLFVNAWTSEQKIDRPSKPRHPLPTCEDASPREDLDAVSRDTRETCTQDSRLDQGTGNRGTEEQGTRELLAAPAATEQDVLDVEVEPADQAEPNPVPVLVGAYVEALEGDGGIATTSQKSAIGANVKRLIRDDKIPLPVLLVAVQRAGQKRARTVDPFLGDARRSFESGRQAARQAMFRAWEDNVAKFANHRSEIGA